MAEMVEDERTGWLAPDLAVAGMVDGLTDALRRCLAASPEKRSRMGELACEAVARICDNRRIVDEQIAFRASVQRHEALRSVTVAALSYPLGADEPIRATQFEGNVGIVVCARTCADAEPTLRSIATQTTPVTAIALVCSTSVSSKDVDDIAGQNVVKLLCSSILRSEAWNAGYVAIQERVASGLFLFLDSDDVLQPDCVGLMKQTLDHRPEVGLVAAWIGRENGLLIEAPLCPELTHQLVRNDVRSVSAVRAEAIGSQKPFHPLAKGYDLWQLSVTVLAKGWIGVTVPAMLAERRGKPEKFRWPDSTALRAIRADLLQAASSRISPIVLDLLNDYVPLSLAGGDTGPPQSSVSQIMTLLKAGARRKISRARAKLLTPRRPTENV